MTSASSDPAAPTAPRPVDAQGHDLDEWGLPISGPARLRRLGELGKPDPNIDPAGWGGAGVKPLRARRIAGRKGKVIVDEAASFSSTDATEVDGDIPAEAALTENGNG